jgi:hypothetical protein
VVADPYFEGYERRNEGAGGVWNGVKTGTGVGLAASKFVGPYAPLAIAGGAVIGGIAGAFTKNAKTAKTDFLPKDARQILQQVYRQELGRDATPQEIESTLAGQGLKAGDKGVGEAGMRSVIAAIRNSPEGRLFRSTSSKQVA